MYIFKEGTVNKGTETEPGHSPGIALIIPEILGADFCKSQENGQQQNKIENQICLFLFFKVSYGILQYPWLWCKFQLAALLLVFLPLSSHN